MGIFYTDITLKNAGDRTRVKEGLIKEQEVRETRVQALVDTGAGTLVINEETCQKLGLAIEGLRRATLANNGKEICKVTEPVEIHWKDRKTTCHALVVPGESSILLGAIPLEDMDLMVNPVQQELVGAHGDEVIALLM